MNKVYHVDDDDQTTIYIFEEDSCEDYYDFECAGDEVLVESSPPASPAQMAARLATPAQTAGGGNNSPSSAVRELIVIPELPNSIHLQHAMQQVTSSVVEVNGDSSGHSSPNTETQHTYITVAMHGSWNHSISPTPVKAELLTDEECEDNGVNYHVQYVQPQELYTHGQPHMETLRTYPVYNVTTEPATDTVVPESASQTWTEQTVCTSDDPGNISTNRMPPATVQWLLEHYECADGVSLPRSTLYAHYLRHCTAHRLEPVNAASFGKLIRSVFIGLRTRRLGTRGNSKYHYYGIRAKPNAQDTPPTTECDKTEVTAPQEPRERDTSEAASVPGSDCQHRQYLGTVTPPEPPALTLPPPHPDIAQRSLCALLRHHRDYGTQFLEAVATLDTSAVERTRRGFWRRPPRDLPRRDLFRLARNREVCNWLRKADLQLHQKAVELLLPDVLSPIPANLTQSIRNFAKSLESALTAGSAGAPSRAVRAQARAASALAAALRRYTSLNHLAQAARAVLHNRHQIHQMLADLNRVDFRVVREQAAWACACGSAGTAARLEADFKATLARGASLEQWAGWLEECVRGVLLPHEKKHEYGTRARRLLLDWSFYSSLVIRELTLRSAASFGSFHLLRLLYDEYVAFLIERRVAQHEHTPPIAVMHAHYESEDDDVSDCQSPEGNEDQDDDDPDWEWDDEDENDNQSNGENNE